MTLAIRCFSTIFAPRQAGCPWGFSKCTYDKKCKSKKAADWAKAAKWWAKQWADIFKAEQALDNVEF